MDLPNLKELKAIFKLCRSQGVSKITLAEMVVEFGDMPMVAKNGEMIIAEEEDAMQVGPSEEDLKYWSAAPDPLLAREGADQ